MPPRFPLDEEDAEELDMFIQNDPGSYNHAIAMADTIRRHHLRGNFNYDLAVQGMTHVAARAAGAYHEQQGLGGAQPRRHRSEAWSPSDPRRWHEQFGVPTRRRTAERLVDRHLANIQRLPGAPSEFERVEHTPYPRPVPQRHPYRQRTSSSTSHTPLPAASSRLTADMTDMQGRAFRPNYDEPDPFDRSDPEQARQAKAIEDMNEALGE